MLTRSPRASSCPDTMKMISSLSLLRAAALAACVLSVACSDPEVLAKVGDSAIRKADLQRVVGDDPRGREAAPVKVLDTLISRELLAEAAREAELDKDPKVSAQLASAEREVLAQALVQREIAPHVTDAALRKRYEASKAGLEQRQVHVRHIMVRLPSAPSADQRRTAQQRINFIYARLVGGSTFEEVVKEVSSDPAHHIESADLGVLREGQVHPALFDAALILKQNEYSKPLETPFGFHVLQALAPASTVTPSYEEIRSRLAVEARREAEASLVQRLSDQISVKRYPERLEALQHADAGVGSAAGDK